MFIIILNIVVIMTLIFVCYLFIKQPSFYRARKQMTIFGVIILVMVVGSFGYQTYENYQQRPVGIHNFNRNVTPLTQNFPLIQNIYVDRNTNRVHVDLNQEEVQKLTPEELKKRTENITELISPYAKQQLGVSSIYVYNGSKLILRYTYDKTKLFGLDKNMQFYWNGSNIDNTITPGK